MLPLTRLLQIQNDFDYKRTIRMGRQQPLEARIGERHAASGRETVTFPNGGKAIAGVRTFEASVPVGTRVMASQAPGSQAISLAYKDAPNITVPETEDTAYPIKILFYGTIDGVTGYYIGGDRPIPKKVDVPPESGRPRLSYSRGQYQGFTNSGKGLNNWIAAFIKNNELPYIENKFPTTYMVDGFGNIYENSPEMYVGYAPLIDEQTFGAPVLTRAYLAYPYSAVDVDGNSLMKCYYQDFYFWSSTLRHFISYFSTPSSNYIGGNYTSTVCTFKDTSKSAAFNIGGTIGYIFFWPQSWNVVESFIKPDFALRSGVTLGENLGHWNSLLNGKGNETAIAVKSSYPNQNIGTGGSANIPEISSKSIDKGEYQFFFVAPDNSLAPIDKDVIFNFGFQAAFGITNYSSQFNLKLPTSQEWAGYDLRTHFGTLVGNVLYKPIIGSMTNAKFEKDGTLDIRTFNFISKIYTKKTARFYKIPSNSNIQKIAYYPV